jgi:hypothetical protein
VRTTRRGRALLLTVAVLCWCSVACGRTSFGDRTSRTQELVWLDARGQVTDVVPHSGATYTGVWLAPDERTAIVLLDETDVPPPDRQLWRIDLVTGETAPIEGVPATVGGPGGRLTYWSDGSGAGDVWSGSPHASPYRVTPWVERGAQLSAEGQWIAYVSEESGKPEVYIQTFPDSSHGRWLASGPEGGEWPVWRRDSRRLYYWAADGRLMAVPLKPGRALVEPGRPIPLFEVSVSGHGPYAVNLDERVLMALSRSRPTPP